MTSSPRSRSASRTLLPNACCPWTTMRMAALLQAAELGRPEPARLGDVDGHAIGRRVFHFHVAVGLTAVAHPERLVDVVATRGAGCRQLVGDRFQALHLEAEVMNATPVLAPLDAG